MIKDMIIGFSMNECKKCYNKNKKLFVTGRPVMLAVNDKDWLVKVSQYQVESIVFTSREVEDFIAKTESLISGKPIEKTN